MKFYNTLTRRKQVFSPLKANTARMYSCGPTVYNYAHIGNLRTYIFSDVLRRSLEYCGYNVKHVMNITDVGHLSSDADIGEDKMLLAVMREKRSVWALAEYYTGVFKHNLQALNILPPHIWCKATAHISEQIALIRKLEKKGYTYRINDGIYFDTSKFKDYHRFARLKLSSQKAGGRVEENKEKKHAWDFALWKFSPHGVKREMEWESPWGVGFPGWHIECSAMSVKYLGQPFDIHTGGIDHIPIHHTNEIAQSTAAQGKQMARWWVHAEFLVIDKARMGKSEGNFITLQHIIEHGFEPLDYRFFCYSAHYRAQLSFSWDALLGARQGRASLMSLVARLKLCAHKGKLSHTGEKFIESHEAQFRAALTDDLNIPKCIGILFSYLQSAEKNKDFTNGDYSRIYEQILSWDGVFGLRLDKSQISHTNVSSAVQKLVMEREQARTAKNWNLADRLRKRIEAHGFCVQDTPQGPSVVKA